MCVLMTWIDILTGTSGYQESNRIKVVNFADALLLGY